MSAELLIFLSVMFSVLLSAIGWVVQWKLLNDNKTGEDPRRYLHKMLHRLEVDLAILSERQRSWEAMSLIVELLGNNAELSAPVRQEMISRLRGKLAALPSEDQMKNQMNEIAKVLGHLAQRVSQTAAQTQPAAAGV